MPIALHYAARSDLGLGSKSRNEDSAYAGPDLLVLADGMGGHAAGDVASSTVVGELVALDGLGLGADDAQKRLRETIERANAHLREAMEGSRELQGMGTTCIAMLRAGTSLVLAHIGDSRAFLLRDGTVTQITKDHSFVQTLVDEGRITPEEAAHHPQRNMVTRVLTGREEDTPDISLREGKRGDRYLLCSDGLTDYVGRRTVEEILAAGATPAETADRLIAIALRASTRDNVTVVVADVLDQAEGATSVPQVVGAAADRHTADGDQGEKPATPAEKAAALRRAVTEPEPSAEETATPRLAEEGTRGSSARFRLLALTGMIGLLLALGAFVAHRWSQQQFYVGERGGLVTVYRGVPQRPAGMSLSSLDTTTDIAVSDLPQYYAGRVREKLPVGSRTEALRIVEDLRAEMVQCQTATADGEACRT